jgi:hypothetical protein
MRMKRLVAYNGGGQVTVRDCVLCGRSCGVARFRMGWEERPTNTCLELARVAAEVLTVRARSCEEWKQWTEAATRYLWWLLWGTPVKHVDSALAAATMRFIQKYARDQDIGAMCAALDAHGPSAGEAARITGGPRAGGSQSYYAPPPQVCWVRCEKHRSWCAVGLRRVQSVRGLERCLVARRTVGLHFIAAHSRSCEEFRARRTSASITNDPDTRAGYDIRFAPVARSKWVRDDQAGTLTLRYDAASWTSLAPALGPWDKIAAKALGGAG